MFRMMKLKPPHGWNAVAWELAIVTLGVLIALAAQQWADDWSWRSKARQAADALRDEVEPQYFYSTEWRAVTPCIQAQIDVLEQRLLASGSRLTPAPVYSEPGFDAYVLRMPNRPYPSSAWQAALSDGVVSHFDRQVQLELGRYYAQAARLAELTDQNNSAYSRLFSLRRPLELDPTVRFSHLQTLAELRGRVEQMDLLSGQIMGNLERTKLLPTGNVGRRILARSGTYKFCRQHRLPLRGLDEARTPIPD